MSRTLIKLVLAGVGVCLAVIAVRLAFTATAASPAAAAHLALDSPEVFFRTAVANYAPGKRLPPYVYRRARELAKETPLAAEPFILLGIEAIERGNDARGIALLEEARRRNPRQRMARVLLLDRYARAGEFNEAALEAAAIGRLVPDAGKVIVDVMAQMVLDPAATKAMAQAMRGDPSLDALLSSLVLKGARVEDILEFARSRPPGVGGAQPLWQAQLVDRMARDGDYSRARTLWARFGKLAPDQAKRPYYNLDFNRSDALAPFNWRLTADDTGVAEFGTRNVATIEFFGRKSGELMGQLLTLTPGSYRMSFVADGKADAKGSRLVWFIRCAPTGSQSASTGDELLSAVISGVANRPRRLNAAFTVPAERCPAQWLTLEGVAAEFPTNQSIELRALSIQPTGVVK